MVAPCPPPYSHSQINVGTGRGAWECDELSSLPVWPCPPPKHTHFFPTTTSNSAFNTHSILSPIFIPSFTITPTHTQHSTHQAANLGGFCVVSSGVLPSECWLISSGVAVERWLICCVPLPPRMRSGGPCRRYAYCIWCGCAYRDQVELDDNCPGDSAEAHD